MDSYKYLVTFGQPDQDTADKIGYWPNGIDGKKVGAGNPQMERAHESGWKGDIEIRREEAKNFIHALIQAGVPTLELPYPNPQRLQAIGVSYDVEFLRDQVVARRDGTVMAFPMGTPHRTCEAPLIETIYRAIGVKDVVRLGKKHEGGNIVRLFMPDGTAWVFSGTSERTAPRAVQGGFRFLKPDTEERQFSLGVKNGEALHVDCIFKPTVAVIDGETVVTFIVHPDGLSRGSQKRMETAAKMLSADIIEISRAAADSMATNGVIHDGTLINPVKLSNPKKQAILEARLKEFVHVPTTQTAQVGGAFHCLTQELWMPEPINAEALNWRLYKTGLFKEGSEAKVHNNHE